MSREPLWNTAIITSVIGALIALLTSFGVPMTDAQQAAISGFVLVIAPLLVAWIGRNYVTPVSDPRIQTNEGKSVALVRQDTHQPPVKGDTA